MAQLRRSSRTAKAAERTNHVFVDFENVSAVDLALIGEKKVEVVLLIGEKQRRLELGLVRQIHEYAAKVTLVEVGVSGRNALDLVLAWHLGKTAEQHPDDLFFVVSKDKDFDPLLVHLRARGFEVERVDAFAKLPFFPAPKKSVLARRPAETKKPSSLKIAREPSPAAPPQTVADGRLAKIIDRLQHKTKARPVRKKSLLGHVNGFYGNQLSDTELEHVIATLMQLGIVAIDSREKVTYPAAG